MNSRTALLIGASGLVGGHCLKLLLADPFYKKVIAPVRHPLEIRHESLKEVLVDFDRLEDNKADIFGDDVFCCLGTTINKAGSQEEFRKVDLTYPVRSAEIAFANGSRQFLLVSAVGADPDSSIFYNRVKGEVEVAIGHIDFNTYHIFHPSLLIGQRKESRPGEKLAQLITGPLSFAFLGPLRKYRPVEAEAVAFAMVEIAKENWQGRHTFSSEMICSIYQEYKDD